MIIALEPIDNGCSGNVWACNGDRASAVASTGRRLRNDPVRRAALRYVKANCPCIHGWTGKPSAIGYYCGRYVLDSRGAPHFARCPHRLQPNDAVVVRGNEGTFYVVATHPLLAKVTVTAASFSTLMKLEDVFPVEVCFA